MKTNSEPPRPISHSYWVVPGRFLAGQSPARFKRKHTRQRLTAFLQQGFDLFLDLTTEGELPPYAPLLYQLAAETQQPVEWERHPIGDFGLPTPAQMTALLDRIDRALAAGRKIYLHCWAGIGRTGTAVGCYLVRHGLTGEAALEQVDRWCFYARSPETAAQRDFIRHWKHHDAA